MNSNGTILIVDDDPAYRAHVAEILRADGYTLAEADSGEQALERYAQTRPGIVLLEVEMPGLGGLETCRQLKQRHGEECAPVVFFMSAPDPATIAQGFAAGGVDYLSKPCSPDELRARIRSHQQTFLLVQQQKQLVEQLNRANAAKNRFLGMAAHDMRNPLVSIRGFSEFLIDGTVGELGIKQLALAKIIRATSQSMIDTLNQLLDVATIESGELKLQLAPHNLVDLVSKSVSLNKIDAIKKRTRIVLEAGPDRPVLQMDADKMRQVADNLLSNAIKYSPPASIITVVTHADPRAGTCGFSVRDQGPGIPDAERHKLFKAFGRLSVQPTLGEKSVGLGLAICRNIVEAHHGTIIAENLPERGCEFRVTLPLTP